MPPVAYDHNTVPDGLNALTALSSLPMYSVPKASTSGEDSKEALINTDQLTTPDPAFTLYSFLSVPPKYRAPVGDSAADVKEMAVVDTVHRIAPLATLTANRPFPPALTYAVPPLSNMGEVSTVPCSCVAQTGTTVPACGPTTSERHVCWPFRPNCAQRYTFGVMLGDTLAVGVIVLVAEVVGVTVGDTVTLDVLVLDNVTVGDTVEEVVTVELVV